MNEDGLLFKMKMKHKSNCLIDKTTKFLEEHKRVNFVNVNLVTFSQIQQQKHKETSLKCYASKDTIKKDNSENGGKYWQIMYLIKNYNQNIYIHTYI